MQGPPFRTKSGIEESGPRAEGIEAGSARHYSIILPPDAEHGLRITRASASVRVT
jgi:hypothetical protein